MNENKLNTLEQDNQILFDPRILDGEKDVQVVWTTESMELAKNGIIQGYQLKSNPFLRTVKDVQLRKANLPFKMSDDERWAFEKCMFDKVFFGNNFTSLKDAQHGWRRIKLRDYQEKLLDNYNKNRWNILLFPRQSGKTTTTVIEIVHFLTFNVDKDCVVIAQSERVVLEILSKVKEVFASMPFFLQPGFLSFTKTGCKLDNGCRLVVGVASESVVQGFSLDMVFLDEFAYISPAKKAQAFWNNIYPTLANNPESKCIIASTPNGRNLFWELWNNSINKRNMFTPLRIYWTDVPGRDEKFKRETIQNVGIEGWEMGFECSFDTQLKSIFNSKIQKTLRELQKEAEPKTHDLGSIINSENPDKDNESNDNKLIYWSKDNHYIGELFNIEFINNTIIPYDLKNDYFMIGIDISEGLEQDYTTLKIRKLFWDKNTHKITYKNIGVFKDNTISVEDFAELSLKLFKFFDYNKTKVCVDLTNYGNEYFAHVKKLKLYDSRYFEHDDIIFAKYESNTKKDYELGCRWNKQNKKMGVRSLTGLVNTQEFFDNHYDTIEEYLNFGKNSNDSYSAQYGHDDLIMADVLIAHFVKSNNLYANEFLRECEYSLRIINDDLTCEMQEIKTFYENKNKEFKIDGMFIRDHNSGYINNNHRYKSKYKNMIGSLSIDKHNHTVFENYNYLSDKKFKRR